MIPYGQYVLASTDHIFSDYHGGNSTSVNFVNYPICGGGYHYNDNQPGIFQAHSNWYGDSTSNPGYGHNIGSRYWPKL